MEDAKENEKERAARFPTLTDEELSQLLAELMAGQKASELGTRLDAITVALLRVLARA